MTRADDYREKAAAADEMAAQVFFSEVEEQFHQIADGWRALATQTDQISRAARRRAGGARRPFRSARSHGF